MAAPRFIEDRVVTELKLREVTEFIQALERRIQRVSGPFEFDIGNPAVSGADLIHILIDEMKWISGAEYSLSLIAPDFRTFHRLKDVYTESGKTLSMIEQGLDAASSHEDCSKDLAALIGQASFTILKACLLPAKVLRVVYIARLSNPPVHRHTTVKRTARDQRDARIRELSKSRPSLSIPELLEVAIADDVIKLLSVRVSREILRNVLKRKGGKTARR